MDKCIFVAAGDFSERYFDLLMQEKPGPHLVAVDAGYRYIIDKGFRPDIAIGDFDSLKAVPGGEVKVFPTRKDKPDTMLAIDYAKEKGFDTAFVLGAFGGRRLDHTVSNLQQIFYAYPELRLVFLDDRTLCFGAEDETVIIGRKEIKIYRNPEKNEEPVFSMPEAIVRACDPGKTYLSLFTQEKATVALSGTAYDGENIKLNGNFPLGVSNEITDESCSIRVFGKVIIMLCGTLGV